jgi:hypothetical protein
MLTYDKARRCYVMIAEAQQAALRKELLLKALEYARIRAQQMVSSLEQRKEIDQRRTIAHNAFIDACNIMSRSMGMNDEENSWRAELGDDRKLIGDFACYVHCFLGIEAR